MAPKFNSVSEFITIFNQTIDYAYPSIEVEGEVASYKVNQGKFVFFDLKDEVSSVGCFMMLFQLRLPIEDGMRVVVKATPKLTQWGKFSLTVKSIQPSGQGSIKKSFDLLRKKLDDEGLFAPERKRQLPRIPLQIGVISSAQAAGYADFIKILNDRWGGLRVDVASVAVQGVDAPDQIIRAIEHFNSRETELDAIVIIRGGGSADDLSAFNDEKLVRTIVASRTPILTGIGHETDVTLADLAADVRASTPSNAAQIIVPDKNEIIRLSNFHIQTMSRHLSKKIEIIQRQLQDQIEQSTILFEKKIARHQELVGQIQRLLTQLDPQKILDRGFALIHGNISVGARIVIETKNAIIKAKVETYEKK